VADEERLPGGPGERGAHALRTQLPATLPFRTDTLARKEARAGASMTAGGPGLFGALLRQQRRAVGLSQAELAERAGLSRRGISDLERGERRRPYPATVRRLVEALGLEDTQRAALLAAARQQTPAERMPEPAPAAPSADRPDRPGRSSARATLPRPLTSFVGRERELGDVRRLLGTTRLLTLTGTGGVGKTRLAVALACALGADKETAVAFVELAPLADPQLLAQTVASKLGVREQPGRPVLATLVEVLQGKELLLVLDNCEHLVQECATLGYELLSGCPDLSILATSREPLGIAGETVWRVRPLSLPEPGTPLEHVGRAAAIQLFVERARAVLPGFELSEQNARAVADVCRRLDGIPLALELAAAHAPLLSAAQIAARLDDALGLLTRGSRLASARQQTVRATLDWSYGLLAAPERIFLDRLAVFAGGWTLEAAEAVAGTDGIEARDVLSLLGQLVDKSLVVVEPGPAGLVRYRLLEVVRQYGLERLTTRGHTPSMQDRHAAFFLTLAEQTEPELFGRGGLAAQARLEREHDNCRAALRWLIAQADTERAQRLAGALGRFWFFRGYLSEGEAWTERVLALPGGDRPTAGRAKTLYGAGGMALARGDYATVERTTREARDLWRRLGNRAEEGFALFVLGHVAQRQGELQTARAFLEDGLTLSRTAGQGAAEANCLWALAEVAFDQGDASEARTWAQAALVRATEVGWTVGISVARRVLGAVSLRQGDYPAATALLEASLADARELGARWWIVETLAPLGQLALEQGDVGQAHTCLAESLKLAQELADRASMVRALEGLAQLGAVQGAPRHALRLAGAAAALRDSIRAPLAPVERSRLERRLASARRTLGERAAQAAWAEGRALPLQQVVDLALAGAPADSAECSAKRGRSVLTAREEEVARLVARGLTNRQIAEHLFIAEGTAERHVGNILAKLDVHTRSRIAAWTVEQGLLRQDQGG
jgi:predicted ATPase/DNA-binding CsgD family transcriptional regulator/DNA-binding XRE family transcriptional regulator